MYDPHKTMPGGFSQNDGTIDFYNRVNSVATMRSTVLDLGAGRAAWFEDDSNMFRKSTRLLKGKVAQVIAADIDEAVLQNRASDSQVLIRDGIIPVDSETIDIIIADYVLEHVDNVSQFTSEVGRILKKGGYFCARTPHKYNYVSVASRLIGNNSHAKVLMKAQATRKSVDVFPTAYRLNTIYDIRHSFLNYEYSIFIYRADPSYFFGSKAIFATQSLIHRLMPPFFSGNIFAFLRK